MQIDAGIDRVAAGRLAAIWGPLSGALDSVRTPGRPPSVLDCGGGSGTYAVPLAAAGARLTVVDISADALTTLRRRAAEAGVADLVHPVQGDAESLAELQATGLLGSEPRFDLVLAHGILDTVDRLADTFVGLADAVRPGGLLSVLVANPAAAVLARALAGEPAAALAELNGLDAAEARLGPGTVQDLCAASGLVVQARHGIGTFSDLVPGSALDRPGARDALARLDAAAAARAPFTDIAGRVHLLARRPGRDGGR